MRSGSYRNAAMRTRGNLQPPGYARRIRSSGAHRCMRCRGSRTDCPASGCLHCFRIPPQASVRSLAAYLLRERHGEDAAVTWRAMLDHAGPVPLGALTALADHAQPEDAVRFRRWLDDRSSPVRAASLRGLLKAGAPPEDESLVRLLARGGNRVRWFLQRHVRQGDIPLDAARVARLVASPLLTEKAGTDLHALTLALGHWPSLKLLLQLPIEDDVALRTWWRGAVAVWVRTSGDYAPMGPQTGAQLLQALDVRRNALPEDAYAIIRSAIGRH